MNAEDVLISESDFSVGVLGRGEEFVLFPLGEPLDEAAQADAKTRGLVWCGVLGIKDGIPSVRCAPHPESVYTMCFAGMGFARLVVERIRPVSKGDAAQWLQALHNLQDLRT